MANFIEFREVETKGVTKRFEVRSCHSGDYLGYIAWDNGWRRYVMNFDTNCKWSIECMAQCYKFIQKLMDERRNDGLS